MARDEQEQKAVLQSAGCIGCLMDQQGTTDAITEPRASRSEATAIQVTGSAVLPESPARSARS